MDTLVVRTEVTSWAAVSCRFISMFPTTAISRNYTSRDT